MKKHIFIITIILAISITTIIYNVGKIKTSNNNSNKLNIESTEKAPIYILKDYKGNLALFDYKSNEPMEIYNIYTESLPKSDTNNLILGIKIYDEKELKEYLSDYLS